MSGSPLVLADLTALQLCALKVLSPTLRLHCFGKMHMSQLLSALQFLYRASAKWLLCLMCRMRWQGCRPEFPASPQNTLLSETELLQVGAWKHLDPEALERWRCYYVQLLHPVALGRYMLKRRVSPGDHVQERGHANVCP